MVALVRSGVSLLSLLVPLVAIKSSPSVTIAQDGLSKTCNIEYGDPEVTLRASPASTPQGSSIEASLKSDSGVTRAIYR